MYRRVEPGAGCEFLPLTFPPIEIPPPLVEEKIKNMKKKNKTTKHKKAPHPKPTLHLPFVAVTWGEKSAAIEEREPTVCHRPINNVFQRRCCRGSLFPTVWTHTKASIVFRGSSSPLGCHSPGQRTRAQGPRQESAVNPVSSLSSTAGFSLYATWPGQYTEVRKSYGHMPRTLTAINL